MDLLILSITKDEWEAERLAVEARKMGLRVKQRLYQEIELSVGERGVISRELKPKMVICRSAWDLKRGLDMVELACVLRERYVRAGSYVFNYEGMSLFPMGKLRQQVEFARIGLPIVKTWVNLTIERAQQILAESGGIVLKPVRGSEGKGVIMINNPDRLEEMWEEVGREYVAQELLKAGEDYRVLVLGGEGLGVMKRKAGKGKFVTNFSQGGEVEVAELPKEVLKIAIEAAKLFALEYAGVDLMQDLNGVWRILEVNRFGQFRGFEKATGVNVAREIVEYCWKQVQD